MPWLLSGDLSIRWQVLRDLVGASPHDVETECRRVAVEGWGVRLLAAQDVDGQWSHALYSPKWTSTTYTLLLLHWLGLPSGHPQALAGCRQVWDGARFYDGGWNCETVRSAFRHGSFHTSISTLRCVVAVGSWSWRTRWSAAAASSSTTSSIAPTARARWSTRPSPGSPSRHSGTSTCSAGSSTSGGPVRHRMTGWPMPSLASAGHVGRTGHGRHTAPIRARHGFGWSRRDQADGPHCAPFGCSNGGDHLGYQ